MQIMTIPNVVMSSASETIWHTLILNGMMDIGDERMTKKNGGHRYNNTDR